MTTVERSNRGAIRQATRADLLDVFRIEKAAFPQPWPFSAFERYLEEPGFLVYEAPESGAGGLPADPEGDRIWDATPVAGDLAGFVVAATVPNQGRPLGHVKDLAVAPPRQGEGIGTAILERGLAALAAQGVRTVKLEVRRSNERAISLYRRAGFEYHRTISGYYADEEDGFVLVADLADRETF